MLEAVSTDRSRVSERIARLPLAGTRITADRGARRDRPASAAASGSETADFLHREACRLAAREAQHRVVQARLIAALMKRRLWRPLGFVRLSDYAAERLGVRARSLQEDARVANSLELLPRIRSAVGIGALRWTHARLLAGMATPATEDEWLRMALVSTTRRLAELVKAARRGDAGATDADPDACALVRRAGESSPERPDPDACALPRRVSKSSPERLHPDACASSACAGKSAPERLHPDACASPGCAGESSPDHLHPDACASQIDAASSCTLRGCAASADPEESESDPPLLWSMDVTRAGRRLWRVVGDLASRMCGTDVPASRVAEAVAAEAMSWVAWEPPLSEPMPPRARRARATSELTQDFAVEESERFREPDRVLEKLALDVDSASAHEIDRRLRIVRSTMQRIDAELGAVLRKSFERNVPSRLGFPDLRLYSEIRLGICGSKAMALVRLDRQCAQRSPALLQAYREGRASWLAATTLLPIISRKHGDAWKE